MSDDAELDFVGCKRLVAAMIMQSLIDAGGSDVELRQDGFNWVRSEDARNLADLAGIELSQEYRDIVPAIARARELNLARAESAKRGHRRRRARDGEGRSGGSKKRMGHS